MTCTVCPNCGLDLEKFTPIHKGDLDIEPHEARWRGKRVPLTLGGRILLSAIVRADGVPVKNCAISEALGSEAADPNGTIKVQVSRVRSAFKSIDPVFDAIETVWGIGYRWAA